MMINFGTSSQRRNGARNGTSNFSRTLVTSKGLPPEDPETSHSPDHVVPSTTQMGQVRIWEISDYLSKLNRNGLRVAKKIDYKVK